MRHSPIAQPTLPFASFLHPTSTVALSLQFAWLLILSIPVACIAWTITHEEAFREPRECCQRLSKQARTPLLRKFFYLFTCEYCFSHYVAGFMLVLTRLKLLYLDWRGYVVALFALVWVANQYMSIYNRLRLDIKHEQVQIKQVQIKAQEKEQRKEKEKKEQPAGALKSMPERAA
jgi:hypothetical protein